MEPIDARGLECPQPVIMTKKAIEKEHPERLMVLVTGETPRGNVTRFAESQGYRVEVNQDGETYRMMLTKDSAAKANAASPDAAPAIPAGENVVVFITTDRMGSGNDELGALLMKAFVNTIRDISPRPKTIIFANAGVYLTTEGSPVLDSLKSLEEKGAAVLSCGTCLEFFKLKEKLRVGTVSNMYTIAETLFAASNVVKL